jgi:DNA-binding NarL/FixJ family response regulator
MSKAVHLAIMHSGNNPRNPEIDHMSEKIRILIIDDSHSFRLGMKALLEIQPDMQVVGEASSGDEVMNLVQAQQPDLILLDAQMPGLNGIDVTRSLKNYYPKIKVILMTMFADYRPSAIAAGADSFLTKGIPPEHVLALIRGIASAVEPERMESDP